MTKYRRKDGPFRFAYVFVASCKGRNDWWYWPLVGQTVLVYLTGWEKTNNERFGESAGAFWVGQAYGFTVKKGGAIELGQDFDFDDIIFV